MTATKRPWFRKHSGMISQTRSAYVSLDGFNVFRFRAFFALGDIKTDALAFSQGLETGILNGAEMHENIAALFILNEAEALAFVEPLYFTF